VKALVEHGAAPADIAVHWVPGSLEIPLIAQEVAFAGEFDAIVCLGTVIRGETGHYEVVAREAGRGVARVGLEHRLPCTLGILTTETLEQALERAGGARGNKGADAALAAVEMVSLTRSLRSNEPPSAPGDAASAG
jgi:6,7-dimethyl-8-ribityllumazine synthase